jgi:hypothetical protein
MGHPMSQGVCLAGAGAGDDQKRAGDLPLHAISEAMLDGHTLSFVQGAQVRWEVHRRAARQSVPLMFRS